MGPCGLALTITVESSDADPLNPFTAGQPINEYGSIQCTAMGAGTHYFITEDLWSTAFPSTSQWKTLTTYVMHLTVSTPTQLMGTVIAVGGGEMGVSVRPDGG